jgi:hypothetical protein
MGGGYLRIDKDRVTASSNIVAIIAEKGKKTKSTIITKTGNLTSKVGPKRLIERIDGDKKE